MDPREAMHRRPLSRVVVGALALVAVLASVAGVHHARAADETANVGKPSAAHEMDDAFGRAVAALQAGRPADAIADLEAIADQGTVDAHVSFDRGLAYAQRVRLGGGQPGDLGRAAHGFEEARELPSDPALDDDAQRALAAIRAEVARRSARAGASVELDQSASLGESIVHLVPENAWAIAAAIASLVTALGLVVRVTTRKRRVRVGANVALAVATPLLVAFAGLTRAAQDDRLHRTDGVIVTSNARPSDARGIALPKAGALPEGARVRIATTNAAWTEVRWGSLDAWVPTSAVRPLARPH
jgi:hypothetical protein